MAKNTGKVREFCQSGKVGTLMYCRLQTQWSAPLPVWKILDPPLAWL